MRTLKSAIRTAQRDSALRKALAQLAGCPVGGWAETDQAVRRIHAELPSKQNRSYSVADLIHTMMEEDHAGRWRFRPT